MEQYYRLRYRDGSIVEDLTAGMLRSMAVSGKIGPNDYVAISKTDQWTVVSRVKGLRLSTGHDLASNQSPDRHHEGRSWRAIVQQSRQLVPLIECTTGQGAGLLVAANGLILTNRHVIDSARNLMVTFFDGTRAKATVVHASSSLDLALIRAAVHMQCYFDLATKVATDFDAGDEVLAIGHPNGLTFTSTRGIVSAHSRELSGGTFVQTDVAINPGNSGGPLLDYHGNLVGLNTFMHKNSQGLGFALPADQVASYFRSVSFLISSGAMPLATDEGISESQSDMSPEEVVEGALRTSGLRYKGGWKSETTGDEVGAWDVWTEKGVPFFVIVDSQVFFCTMNVATLTQSQMKNAAFFRELLIWQSAQHLVRFSLNAENELYMKVGRSAEHLDLSEALSSITQMASAIDTTYHKLMEYLS